MIAPSDVRIALESLWPPLNDLRKIVIAFCKERDLDTWNGERIDYDRTTISELVKLAIFITKVTE